MRERFATCAANNPTFGQQTAHESKTYNSGPQSKQCGCPVRPVRIHCAPEAEANANAAEVAAATSAGLIFSTRPEPSPRIPKILNLSAELAASTTAGRRAASLPGPTVESAPAAAFATFSTSASGGSNPLLATAASSP